ncbi:MAG: acetamidase/formamidase family protein [Trueperaceae bacterium]|nr:acetamidase/formamidase family protein [Trueperaceae bacterium]
MCGTAIETPMTLRVKIGLKKNAGITRPQFDTVGETRPQSESKGYYATTGIGPDLMEASKDAVRDMIEHLGREYGLEPHLAYTLCSIAVDLKISEIVDAPNWVVSAYLPKAIFR